MYGEVALFEFAGFKDIKLGKKIINHLRADKTPGCWFDYSGDDLRFYDFSGHFSPYVSINCFDAIQKYHNIEPKHVLWHIKKNSHKIAKNKDNTLKKDTKKRNTRNVEAHKVAINFQIGDYPKNNLYSKIGINNETLRKEGVYFPEYYHSNFAKSKHMIKNQIFNPKNTVCVVNYFKEQDKTQMYFPEIGYMKFLGNADINCIKGKDILESKGNVLYITKGVKDYLAGRYVFDLNIISVLSERYLKFPEWLLTLIKKNYKKVVLLYDSDLTGVKMSELIANNYDWITHIRLRNDDLYDSALNNKEETINYFKYFNGYYS